MENFDAYILKNTPEIVEELQKMGFTKSKTFEGVHPYIWVSGDKIYETQNIGVEVYNIGEYFGPYGINCGTNLNMFYALCQAKHLNNYRNYKCYTWEDADEIELYEDNGVKQFLENEYWEPWWNFEIRPSTKKEIIEHFTK